MQVPGQVTVHAVPREQVEVLSAANGRDIFVTVLFIGRFEKKRMMSQHDRTAIPPGAFQFRREPSPLLPLAVGTIGPDDRRIQPDQVSAAVCECETVVTVLFNISLDQPVSCLVAHVVVARRKIDRDRRIDPGDQPVEFGHLSGVVQVVHHIARHDHERGPQPVDRIGKKLHQLRLAGVGTVVVDKSQLRIAQLDKKERIAALLRGDGGGDASQNHNPNQQFSHFYSSPFAAVIISTTLRQRRESGRTDDCARPNRSGCRISAPSRGR